MPLTPFTAPTRADYLRTADEVERGEIMFYKPDGTFGVPWVNNARTAALVEALRLMGTW